MKARLFSLIIALLIWIPGFGQSDSTSVLFVGNSYTYFWNLPQVVEAIAEQAEVKMKVRGSTAGGASWDDHLNGNKDLITRSVIDSEKWDWIILQNHSLSTLNDSDAFIKSGSELIDISHNAGATVLLYETWARAFDPTMQSKITRGYESLASKKGINTVPVGQMWERIRQQRPDLKLYDPDNSHPSHIGTYVTACMFYGTLTGKSVKDIPARIRTIDENGQPLYLLILHPNDAQFIKSMVDDFLELN